MFNNAMLSRIIILCLIFQLPAYAFNQKATEKLRQGIIAGNPDMVKASLSEGSDINAQFDDEKDTLAMLALREYIKSFEARASASSPWNVAIFAGVGSLVLSALVGALGFTVAYDKTNSESDKSIGLKMGIGGLVTAIATIPYFAAVAALKNRKSEMGKRGIVLRMLLDNASLDFSITNNKGETLMDVLHSYAKDMIRNNIKHNLYNQIEIYMKKKMKAND